ncbi:MAG TPA: phosphate ABC transporter permease subunit PstC [Acetobacteraceae bacterium]|nr:phosphate ABC transporter permease subunit PstC [Acetobacteraceae bacterium]
MNFRTVLATVGGIVPASMIAVVVFLTTYAWPAIEYNGVGFLGGMHWNLGNLYADPIDLSGVQILPGASYGIFFLIVGTLLTTLIALLIAVPVGVGAAIFLAEAVPPGPRVWLSFLVELLAAIPSVVFGLWGYAAIVPLMAQHVFPAMAHALGWLPGFGEPIGSGFGLLTSGIVLSLMIVPLIAATLRDAIDSQPAAVREAAQALGATRFETVWRVLLPGLRSVLIGACVLATGRALGETMAVLMVSGNALNTLPQTIYAPVSTMAAFIASQLDSALQDPTGLAVRSLAEVALVLCIISIIVNVCARLLLAGFGARERRGL